MRVEENNMKRAICGVLSIYTIAVIATSQVTRPVSGDPADRALRRLEAESTRRPYIRVNSGIPAVLSVDVKVPSTVGRDPVVQALDFLERYKDIYQLANPKAQLYLHRMRTAGILQHLHFKQRHNGIPVFGADLAVHLTG